MHATSSVIGHQKISNGSLHMWHMMSRVACRGARAVTLPLHS